MPAYRVLIDDNFHYQDADERYAHGVFETAEAAVAACREIVERSLQDLLQPGMAGDALYAQYTMFGEDPFVVTDGGEGPKFSARAYAERRCAEICG